MRPGVSIYIYRADFVRYPSLPRERKNAKRACVRACVRVCVQATTTQDPKKTGHPEEVCSNAAHLMELKSHRLEAEEFDWLRNA